MELHHKEGAHQVSRPMMDNAVLARTAAACVLARRCMAAVPPFSRVHTYIISKFKFSTPA
jgi:hypothetical protein